MKCASNTKAGWQVFKRSLKLFLEAEGYFSDSEYRFAKRGLGFFILPLCELEELSILRKHAKDASDYKSPAIFLIAGKHEYPCPFNESAGVDNEKLKELFGNPEFGNISKAILAGELVPEIANFDGHGVHGNSCSCCKTCLSLKYSYINVLDATDTALWIKLKKILPSILPDDNDDINILQSYRGKYYETFVDYYWLEQKNIIKDNGKNGIIYNIESLSETIKGFLCFEDKRCWLDLDLFLKAADVLYCSLNNINYKERTHGVELEMFRAPIPFPLQELIDAKKRIKTALKGNKIKLLLIDNREDNKFLTINGNELIPAELSSLLFEKDGDSSFGLHNIFDLQMLGSITCRAYEKDNPILLLKKNDEVANASDFDKKKELFDCSQFRLDENYANEVHERIKDADFVLLDFFLDEKNTYLAFDFIRDISEIKKKNGDYSTTWYFITSAVHDSVVKYSQSGLLAEYYESAVVNAGDDPTNKKRQIIFVYKLLTFIQSRLKSFKNYEDMIKNKLRGDGICPKHKEGKCVDEPISCLENILSLTRKYLAEYDEITKIFQLHNKEFKNIIEVFDSLIKKFLWLPEADWQMVQHQTDYINAKLKSLGADRKFSCQYINRELEKRSEIY